MSGADLNIIPGKLPQEKDGQGLFLGLYANTAAS